MLGENTTPGDLKRKIIQQTKIKILDGQTNRNSNVIKCKGIQIDAAC